MRHTCPVGICPEHGTCSGCGVDPEEMTARYANGAPCKRGHECHCVTNAEGLRIAWGICCARLTVGIELMAEEDFHDDVPWARAEDCTCPAERKAKLRKRRASG